MNTNENTTVNPVHVGEGMTLQYPQDSYPYVIVRVSPSGKTAWVKRVKAVDLSTGHEPAYFEGPFPVWSHTYTAEELQSMVMEDAPELPVRRGKHGGWAHKGTPFSARGAVFHRNYSY